MSIDLARTLHDTVDGAGTPGLGDGVGTDLDALVGRVRRRRTRRAVTRGVVGVGAAGAVVLVGTQVVGRRGPEDVLPAADPSAAPGACGSQIAAVPESENTTATLGRANISEVTLGDVGTYGDDTSEDPLEVAGRVLVTQLVLQPRAGQTGLEAFHIDSTLGSRAVYAVTYDGRVVGLQPAVSATSSAPSTSSYWFDEGGHTSGFAATTSLAFEACGPATTGGGAALPDGRYELYALDAGTAGGGGTIPAAVLGGPWALDLQTALPAVTALPDGFPDDEVPVLGDSVYDVFELDGVAASGWVLQTRTSKVNAVDAAAQAVVDAGGELAAVSIVEVENGLTGLNDSTGTVRTAHWTVTLSMRTAKDGTPLLRYRLEPR